MLGEWGYWIIGLVAVAVVGLGVRGLRSKQSATQDEVVRELYPLW